MESTNFNIKEQAIIPITGAPALTKEDSLDIDSSSKLRPLSQLTNPPILQMLNCSNNTLQTISTPLPVTLAKTHPNYIYSTSYKKRMPMLPIFPIISLAEEYNCIATMDRYYFLEKYLFDKSVSKTFDANYHAYDKCLICNANFSSENIVAQLKCTHCFHSGCIYDWINTDDNCPVCQSKIE